MSSPTSIDVSLLVTFHREGILAHSTLNSIDRCRLYAEAAGISCEYILVLDRADAETRRVVMAHKVCQARASILEVDHGDPGLTRNAGIQKACGLSIAIMDGDDYYSTNWIERACHFQRQYGENVILHPELLVSFGNQASYSWQPDQANGHFQSSALLVMNYWASSSLVPRSILLECPYAVTRPGQMGYGYEDWHWNCETIAAGYVHRPVLGSILFYRRKNKDSVVTTSNTLGVLTPPSRLFTPPFTQGAPHGG